MNNMDIDEDDKRILDKYICVDWKKLWQNEKCTESFIRRHIDKVDWWSISFYQKLNESFIREFANKVDWYEISVKQKLSEAFIREFSDKVHWYCISKYQTLSESFIREFQNKVNWDVITLRQKLSESFIREFINKIDWLFVSFSQYLSESFIREYQDKLDWHSISLEQKLSKSFILEFKDKIEIECLFLNYHSYCFETLILNDFKSQILKYNHFGWYSNRDFTKNSPEYMEFINILVKNNNLKFSDNNHVLKIKEFQMRTCRWCPLARKWFHRTRFNWDRYWHYIECWRSNPRFSYVRRKLEREFDEYCSGLKTLKINN